MLSTSAGSSHARRACETPQSRLSNSSQVVGIRVDHEAVAGLFRGPRPAVVEIEALVRAVELEHGPRLGRLAVEGLPVEVEIVARADLAARRMGNDVDVRVLERHAVARHQLRAWLAPANVQRSHHDIEAGEQLIGVVERRVGLDLQLAAVQQPEVGALARVIAR